MVGKRRNKLIALTGSAITGIAIIAYQEAGVIQPISMPFVWLIGGIVGLLIFWILEARE